MAYSNDDSNTFVSRNNGVESRGIRISSCIINRQSILLQSDARTFREVAEDLATFNHPKHGTQQVKENMYSIQMSHRDHGQGVKIGWNDPLPTEGTLILVVNPEDNENGCK